MAPSKEHLEQVLDFLQHNRSNEANFQQIATKLDEELDSANGNNEYHSTLTGIKEKQLTAYTEARQNGGTAWPEFENFVAEFERSITALLKSA